MNNKISNSKIILASKSPRRKEILENAGYDIKIRTQNADETLPAGISPEKAVQMLAEIKASAVERQSGETVIGADTVVSVDGEILGKPRDENDAFLMLKKLSNREHEVFTGVCIITDKSKTVFSERSVVRFNKLSDEEILLYIKSGEPMDKAGAYAIQGKAGEFARVESGSFYNVMGFPIETFNKKFLEILKIY